ncbi:hypothetical protein V8J88_00850 [Massilia sp. W12]|uniref:hypothetical protein n=1 Tax=Massilia sp. W12 TaxID=3126507 RepID=UPI0030CAAC99
MAENSPIQFEEQIHPLLLSNLNITGNSEALTISAPENTYNFTGDSAAVLFKTAHLFTAIRSVQAIADMTGVDSKKLLAVVKYLIAEGIVLDTTAAIKDWSDSSAFVDAILAESAFWRKHLGVQPFWKKMMAGQLSQSVIFGWGIEMTHYVDAANEYMAMGVANCRDSIKVREKLSSQYSEEANHAELFLHGLINSGFDRDALLTAPPLATTRALINFLNEVAMDGTMCYSAVFTLMQADVRFKNANDLIASHEKLVELYPFAKAMLAGMHKHAMIDVALDHRKTLFEEFYRDSGYISRREAESVVNVIRSLAKYFILFFEGIEAYYDREDKQLPRRAICVSEYIN